MGLISQTEWTQRGLLNKMACKCGWYSIKCNLLFFPFMINLLVKWFGCFWLHSSLLTGKQFQGKALGLWMHSGPSVSTRSHLFIKCFQNKFHCITYYPPHCSRHHAATSWHCGWFLTCCREISLSNIVSIVIYLSHKITHISIYLCHPLYASIYYFTFCKAVQDDN